LFDIGQDAKTTIWDVATGREVHAISAKAADGKMTSVAYSPNGKWLVVGVGELVGPDGALLFIDAVTGKSAFRVTCGSVTALAFSPDGRHLAAGGFGGEVRLWSVEALAA
jgi:WD40 repeat protein